MAFERAREEGEERIDAQFPALNSPAIPIAQADQRLGLTGLSEALGSSQIQLGAVAREFFLGTLTNSVINCVLKD